MAAEAQFNRMASTLESGFMILVDYGHPAAQLYDASRPRGTLLAYHRHKTNEEYYSRVGDQDLHVKTDAGELRVVRIRERQPEAPAAGADARHHDRDLPPGLRDVEVQGAVDGLAFVAPGPQDQRWAQAIGRLGCGRRARGRDERVEGCEREFDRGFVAGRCRRGAVEHRPHLP